MILLIFLLEIKLCGNLTQLRKDISYLMLKTSAISFTEC